MLIRVGLLPTLELLEEYTVYFFLFPMHTCWLLTSFEAAGSGFRKSDFYSVWQGYRKFDLLAERDEKIHGQQRGLVSSAYSLKSIMDLEKYVDDALQHFLKRMADIDSQTIDMGKWIQYFAFGICQSTLPV